MRSILLVALALSLAACAASPPAPAGAAAAARSPAAQREVIAAAEALFSAMRDRDTAAVRALFVPGTPIVSLRHGGAAGLRTQRTTVDEFIASLARPGEELRERMWDPRVEVGGDLAALWAPYDFHHGERFSHCGHDAFHFVRQDGRWRIAALTYTVQPTGCDAIR